MPHLIHSSVAAGTAEVRTAEVCVAQLRATEVPLPCSVALQQLFSTRRGCAVLGHQPQRRTQASGPGRGQSGGQEDRAEGGRGGASATSRSCWLTPITSSISTTSKATLRASSSLRSSLAR